MILLVSLSIWAVLLISVVGIFYLLLFGLIFAVAHLVFVAHLRGSGVRLGPEQMPELYKRIHVLSGRLGIVKTPEIYLIQAGGALNALATKFLRSNIVSSLRRFAGSLR